MNLRAKTLHKILSSKYLPNDDRHFIHCKKMADPISQEQLEQVYESLGGVGERPCVEIDGYQMTFGRFVVELDDQLHFNRYRLVTLRNDIYPNMHGVDLNKYRMYCRKHENECLKSGTAPGVWTSTTAEKHFGEAEEPGDLGLNGASGWKMIAYREFVKDLFASRNQIKLLRLSIWDEIMVNRQLIKLNDLLMSPADAQAELLLKYIERKVIRLYA